MNRKKIQDRKRKEKKMQNKEIRMFDFEMRAEQNEEHGHFVTGRPIVFESETDLGSYREKISRNALENTDLRDVRFLVNHDTSMIPLARSRNNNENSTMQLSVNDDGMDIRVDLDVDNNTEAKNLYSAINRGDVTGMSFMFITDKDSWEDLDTDHPVRTIESITKVFEVSAVTFPAYEQTSIEAASADKTLESAKSTLESARKARRIAEAREKILNTLKGGSDHDQ